MTKLLFIGEAPSRPIGGPGWAPFGAGSGLRLATWAGLTPYGMRKRARLINLFDDPVDGWSAKEAAWSARRLWASVALERDVVVLLGRKVATAFDLAHVEPFVMFQTSGPAMAMIPHPSGRNRYWNEPAHVDQAERFLRGLLLTAARRRTRQARLRLTAHV